MPLWPREITDDEAIIRGICSPHHVKNGKLRHSAYRPPKGRDDVSVMRIAWIGADACKRHAKELEVGDGHSPKIYMGLAVLSAGQIRGSGAEVVDTREVFEGHADILHGTASGDGDPPPAVETYALVERAKALAKLAKYYPDPDPTNERWTGPGLSP